MPYEISREAVWVTEVDSHPGGISGILEDLSAAGASLEFVVARQIPEKPGAALIFVAPLKGPKELAAAKKIRLEKAESMFSVRIKGPDKPGLGAKMTGAISEAGIKIRGLTAAAIGRQCVVYFSFANKDDSAKALKVLKKKFAPA